MTEIARMRTVFANGTMIETVTTADVTPAAVQGDAPTLANVASVTTVTPKIDPLSGATLMPPGAPQGAIVAAAIEPTPAEMAAAQAAAAP